MLKVHSGELCEHIWIHGLFELLRWYLRFFPVVERLFVLLGWSNKCCRCSYMYKLHTWVLRIDFCFH
jgi:hypothetical protein